MKRNEFIYCTVTRKLPNLCFEVLDEAGRTRTAKLSGRAIYQRKRISIGDRVRVAIELNSCTIL